MKYDDCVMPSVEQYEKIAKAYALALKKEGYALLRLNQEARVNKKEIVELLNKLVAYYSRLDYFYGTRAHKNLIRKAVSLAKTSLSKYRAEVINVSANIGTLNNRAVLLKRIIEAIGDLIIAYAIDGQNNSEIIEIAKLLKDLPYFC